MNELDTIDMNEVSAEELEQTEGGLAFFLGGLLGIGATIGGFVATKAILEGTGTLNSLRVGGSK
jgi:hypothetical protein